MGEAQNVDHPNSEGIPADLIRAELERIIASRAFDASRRNRDFLRFIVEETLAGRGDQIKAYTIGTAVLQRDDAFDPQGDPIVRIEASRLRRSLERYYLITGQGDPIRIDIPKWRYVPAFRRLHAAGWDGAPAQESAAPALPEPEPSASAAQPATETDAGGPVVSRTRRRNLSLPASAGAALAAVAIALSIGHALWNPATDSNANVAETTSHGPSIIVLPFKNLSGEPAKAYLAGGLTEEVLTSLAQFEALFVYARETGAHYGPATSYQELHRDLGVRYVLDGGVREAAGRIRVTARLVDATTGVQLWASAYEESGTGAGLFRTQSDIAQRVAIEIAQPYGVIATADLRLVQRKAPTSLTAYECVVQVLDYYRHMTVARVEDARACLERSTAREPDYADAWALLGMNYLDQIRLRTEPTSRDQESLDSALHAAQRAAEVAPDSALAQRSLLLVHAFRGEVEAALAAGERALALSPNNAEVLAEFGMRLAFAGQWERGIALIDQAVARNPYHPGWYHTAPALNFYRQGRYAEALEEAKKIDAPGWVHTHTILAMVYGQLGQEEQARAAARRVLELDPNFEKNAWYELRLRNFPEEMAEHMADGWRKAGLQVSARPDQRVTRASDLDR